ncbi:MAG: tetratricopeptide repeat protein [Pseudomonadota bacterium]
MELQDREDHGRRQVPADRLPQLIGRNTQKLQKGPRRAALFLCQMQQRHLLQIIVLAACLGGLCVWAYWPGLKGDFLFDDYVNLPALGASGPVTHWPTFWQYITSGHADPTGRPLAMLSFLIDAHDWPAAPYPFKRTNLLLHLINGTMLALLLARLGKLTLPAATPAQHKRIALAGVLGAAFWLLHPLLVSTTLYIVQREAMLAASFTLLGLLLWLRGRQALLDGRRLTGWSWLIGGLWGCTLLGILSKANGLLLPALTLVLEYTVLCAKVTEPGTATIRENPDDFAADSRRRSYRIALWLLAGPPTLLLSAYLLRVGYISIVHGLPAIRSWTLGERLLTEPRVLIDYLRLLWLPHPFTPGLFNDNVAVSRTLLSPAGTLPAILAVATLILGSVITRHRWPILAGAVLFYFVGQCMESSTLALELYFEHRNYLPAALMFWPLALWLCDVRQGREPAPRTDETNRTPRGQPSVALKALLGIGLLAMLALMTHARASLWGNSRDQALLWARLNPKSPRAQAYAAMSEVASGHPDRAVARITPLLAERPDEVQLALNLLSARCAMGHIDRATLQAAARALRTSRDTGSLLASWFSRAIDQTRDPECPELNSQAISLLLDAALANPQLTSEAGRLQDLISLRGQLALSEGDAQKAFADFNLALIQQVRPTTAFQQAALLASAGDQQLALQHLDYYESIKGMEHEPKLGMPAVHQWVLRRQRYWPTELARLRHTLRADLKAKQS